MEPPAQFANQTIRLQFPKDVHWGDDITVWIAKAGDLARTMYLRVMWPTDAPTTVQPSAGTAMIDRIELLYKDQLVERIYGENLYMLGDLTVTQGKQAALGNMVGTNTTSNLVSYHIPLVFSILKKGLPLCALDEPPKLRVVFQPSSYFTTAVYTKPIQVDLFVDYVYVTGAEREYMRSRELIYVTQSFQRVQFRVPAMTQAPVQFLSEFVNDVKELFWVIQSDASSNVYDYGTTDHLVDLRLILNGQDRITPDYATAQYLRVVQGLQSHTRVPDGRYYMYSFALEPENDTPTGELNMTNIARQQHTLTLSLHIYPRSIRVYALSYNIFSVSKGDGRSMYTIQEAGMQNKSVVDAVPAQVGNFVATVQSPTQVNLAWTPTGASYYIASVPSTTSYTIAPSGTFSFTGLSPATTYTFTISPINKGSIGLPAISNTVKTYADIPQVTGFLGYNPTIITVDLIWDPDLLNKTTLYSVTSNPPSSTPTQTSTIASMTFTGLIPLTSYTFTITPSNALGDGPSTTSSPVTTLSIIPEAVSVLTPSNPTRTTMYLEWLPVLYATLYSITSNPSSTTPTQTTTNAGTFTFTGLTESTSYRFTITPSNGGGSGPSTTSVSASTLLIPPAVSVLTPSNPTRTTMNLTWSPVSYATLYSITSDPPSSTPTQTTETAGTFTFIGLTESTSYRFTITPSNVNGAGLPTTSASASTLLIPPAVTSLTTSNPTLTTMDLTWSSVSYATLYSITSDPPSSTPTQTTETAGTFTFIGLTTSTLYRFTITPSNENGAGQSTTSASASTAFVTSFNAPGTWTSSFTGNIKVLVVGGGGGGGLGGASGGFAGGGGGGGGVTYNGSVPVISGTAYPITVGSGGTAAARGRPSSFSTIITVGGGGGGTPTNVTPNALAPGGSPGGSGGGGGGNNPTGVGGVGSSPGLAGGSSLLAGGGGGGGGKTSGPYNTNVTVGSPLYGTGGKGGDGLPINISGTLIYYGAGGGGGSPKLKGIAPGGSSGGGAGGYGPNTSGVPGTPGTGSGGGGGGLDPVSSPAGSGGSGIIIVAYP